MKPYFLLILIGLTYSSFGQDAPGKKLNKVTSLSKVTVSHSKAIDTNKVGHQANYYVNDTLYGNLCPILNPESLENMSVDDKGSKILITLKKDYQPSFVTIDQLSKKYAASNSKRAIYILEGSLVTNNFQVIDENYVLHIRVTKSSDLPYLKDQLNDVDIISISLKTKSNLEKANTVYIRGNDVVGK